MNILDLLTGAWAIEPDKLREIQAIYAAHFQGNKTDLQALEARLGRPLANEQKEYTVEHGGIAVLQMSGVIAPKANLFMSISGGMSTQMATRQLQAAIDDPQVRAVVLAIDSPGGNVIGTPEMAAAVRELSAQKPIVTHCDGTLASAAYWIGSAANAVYISGSTVQVGSIGVVVDRTYRPDRAVHEESITAGRYKRLAKANEPLSDESRAVVQADVDYVYSVFVDDVAAYRATTSERVLEHMADGRVFRGQQAIDAGLADGITSLDALVARMAADPTAYAKRRKAVFAAAPAHPTPKTNHPSPQEARMPDTANTTTPAAAAAPITRASIEKDHPGLFASLSAEFAAVGATQERERIQAVLALGDDLPGHTALLQGLAFDGKTTAPAASMALLKAEGHSRSAAIAAHSADAPAPAKPSAAPADSGSKTADQKVAEAQALAAEKGIDFVAALKQLGYAH